LKKTFLTSFLIITLLSFLIGGATLAYFTDEKDINEGQFKTVMGTVKIEVDDPGQRTITLEPGEMENVGWNIKNDGESTIWLRVKMNAPGDVLWSVAGDNGKWKQGDGDDYYYYEDPVIEGERVRVEFEVSAENVENMSVDVTLQAEAIQWANDGIEFWPEFPFSPED